MGQDQKSQVGFPISPIGTPTISGTKPPGSEYPGTGYFWLISNYPSKDLLNEIVKRLEDRIKFAEDKLEARLSQLEAKVDISYQKLEKIEGSIGLIISVINLFKGGKRK